MSTDVENQVAAYCSWLEQTHGLGVRPPAGETDEDLVLGVADVTSLAERRTRRRLVVPALLAAAVLVAAVVLVARSGRDNGVVTTPSIPAATTTITPPASTTTPSIDESVQLFDRWNEVAAEPTGLISLGVGDGSNDVGVESCNECDPAKPWAPIVLPDGRFVIADVVNARWLIGEVDLSAPGTGRVTTVVGFGGSTPIAQPIAGDDGRIYSLQAGTDRTEASVWVWGRGAAEWLPLDESDPIALDPLLPPTLEFSPDGVLVDGQVVGDVDVAVVATRPTVSIVQGGDAPVIRVAGENATRQWLLPSGWQASTVGQGGLPDDSAVVVLSPPNGSSFWVHLLADGQALAFPWSPSAAVNGTSFLASDAIVQLEASETGFDLVAHALPVAAGAIASDPDQFAGWPDPPVLSVPVLPIALPDPLPLSPIERIDDATGSGPLGPFGRYFQLWAKSGPDGGVIHMTTTFAYPNLPSERLFDAPGWDRAEVVPSGDSVIVVRLTDGQRDVVISSTGLTEDAVIDVARSLRHPSGTFGWIPTRLPDGYVKFADGWAGPTNSNQLAWSDNGAQIEVAAFGNAPETFVPHQGQFVEIADVNGVRALVVESDGFASVTWSPMLDVVTRVGMREGTAEQVLAIARGLRVVDRTTFEEATVPAPVDDGCNSIFC